MKFGVVYSFQRPPGSDVTHAQLFSEGLKEAELAERLGIAEVGYQTELDVRLMSG